MLNIGILIFPDVEELDFIGPFEVLNYINKIRANSTKVRLIAETPDKVRAFNGLQVLPDVSVENCPPLDILVVPGGKGRMIAMKNARLLQFIKTQAAQARYITSVCTGAFLLVEAGLLTGKKATTYHTCLDELAKYDVQVIPDKKVVPDGKVVTAAGVSSGLELGFYLLRELFGPELAQETAGKIEYKVDIGAL